MDSRLKDSEIVSLFLARKEEAIRETEQKYRAYCHSIALSLLGNESDTEEVMNDAYLAAWNSIPPHQPLSLATFLGKIIRRLSVDRIRRRNAEKRSGELLPILDELAECLPAPRSEEPQAMLEAEAEREAINRFLASLPDTERRVFLCRYWYGESIRELSLSFSFSESRVKSMLHRTRLRLKAFLESEDIEL